MNVDTLPQHIREPYVILDENDTIYDAYEGLNDALDLTVGMPSREVAIEQTFSVLHQRILDDITESEDHLPAALRTHKTELAAYITAAVAHTLEAMRTFEP